MKQQSDPLHGLSGALPGLQCLEFCGRPDALPFSSVFVLLAVLRLPLRSFVFSPGRPWVSTPGLAFPPLFPSTLNPRGHQVTLVTPCGSRWPAGPPPPGQQRHTPGAPDVRPPLTPISEKHCVPQVSSCSKLHKARHLGPTSTAPTLFLLLEK